ncbi:hypothetical protein D3C78_857390 [compost metagenome]
MVQGGHVHHGADVVHRIHRPRGWGDIQRRRVFISVWRGDGIDERIRRFDVIRADVAAQRVGVVPLSVNCQRTVLTLNNGHACGINGNAVDLGDQRALRRDIVRQYVARRRCPHARHVINMVLQHVKGIRRQHRDPRCGIEQEQVLARRQVQRQRARGAAQQRRAQPARLNAHLLESLGRIVKFIDIQVKHRHQRHTTDRGLNGHGAGGAFLHAVDDRIAQIVEQVQPQRAAKINARDGESALRRRAVVDRVHAGVVGQRCRIVDCRDAIGDGICAE